MRKKASLSNYPSLPSKRLLLSNMLSVSVVSSTHIEILDHSSPALVGARAAINYGNTTHLKRKLTSFFSARGYTWRVRNRTPSNMSEGLLLLDAAPTRKNMNRINFAITPAILAPLLSLFCTPAFAELGDIRRISSCWAVKETASQCAERAQTAPAARVTAQQYLKYSMVCRPAPVPSTPS